MKSKKESKPSISQDISLHLNGRSITAQDGVTILELCRHHGIEIPHFCYHPHLSIAGNCRMCLVEVEGSPRPVASCCTPVKEGMCILTHSQKAQDDRQAIMEFLLINHPLDCPVCDQGGDCQLQDLAYFYGKGASRHGDSEKRVVKEKNLGPFITTGMSRCIHCMRCTRFMKEVAGKDEIGALYRGEDMEITSYLETCLESYISGNIIDLCPVGALNDATYAYRGRDWELTHTKTIDTSDAFTTAIIVDHRDGKIFRIRPCEESPWIHDRTRFSYDGYFYQRLETPYIRENSALKPCTWEEALSLVSNRLYKSKTPLALIGPFIDLEALEALKIFWERIGAKSVECRLESPHSMRPDRCFYIMNTKNITLCDFLCIKDIVLEEEAPLLLAELWKIYQKNPFPVVVVGKEQALPFPYTCIESIEAIYKKLERAKYPLCYFGPHSKVYEDLPVRRKDWNGYNVIQPSASRIAALDLNLVSSHPIDLNTHDVIYLLGVDDDINFDLLKDKFVIYQGHHGDRGATVADVILPSSSPMEKKGTYPNVYGAYHKTTAILPAPVLARHDADILKDLMRRVPFSQKQSPAPSCENFRKKHASSFYQKDAVSRASVMMARRSHCLTH